MFRIQQYRYLGGLTVRKVLHDRENLSVKILKQYEWILLLIALSTLSSIPDVLVYV